MRTSHEEALAAFDALMENHKHADGGPCALCMCVRQYISEQRAIEELACSAIVALHMAHRSDGRSKVGFDQCEYGLCPDWRALTTRDPRTMLAARGAGREGQGA